MSLASRRDYHQTIEYAGVMELGGWRSVAVPGALLFVQRTPSRVFAKMQRPARIDVDALQRVSAALGVHELHVEPALVTDLVRGPGAITRLEYARETEAEYVAAFASAGLSPVDARWAHSKTLVVDIRASHEDLVATFERKVRQESGYAYEQVRYETCSFDDLSRELLDEMAPLHAQWRTRDHGTYDEHFLAALRRCFGRDGAVILARTNELVGVFHVLFVDRVAICFDSNTAPTARETFANLGLFLEAARAGRDRGCDLLDLCACWDERYPDLHADWQGFTSFKEKLSPTAIYYPPTFALPLRRAT